MIVLSNAMLALSVRLKLELIIHEKRSIERCFTEMAGYVKNSQGLISVGRIYSLQIENVIESYF